MSNVSEAHTVPGRGLGEDRYFLGTGHFSRHHGPDYEITLIEAELIAALNEEVPGLHLQPAVRRNLVTCGVPLNHTSLWKRSMGWHKRRRSVTYQRSFMDQKEVEQCIMALKDVPGIQSIFEHRSTNMPELQVVGVRTKEDLYLLETPKQLVLLKVKLHWEQWRRWMHLH